MTVGAYERAPQRAELSDDERQARVSGGLEWRPGARCRPGVDDRCVWCGEHREGTDCPGPMGVAL